MASAWQWRGVVAATAQDDRYFLSVAKLDAPSEVFHVGDCVEFASKSLAVILALWESPQGDKSAEVRLLYREYQALALTRRRVAATKAPTVIGEKVYETECVEEVPVAAFARKVAIPDGADHTSVEIAEFVVVGALNTKARRLSKLIEGETLLQRSRALGRRACIVPVEEEKESDTVVNVDVKRKAQPSGHAGVKRPRKAIEQEVNGEKEPHAKRPAVARGISGQKSNGDCPLTKTSPVVARRSSKQESEVDITPASRQSPVVARGSNDNGGSHRRNKKSPVVEAAVKKLQCACKELLLSSLPRVMTGREDERDEIYAALHSSIEQQSAGGPIYISGLPGAGKTSIVKEVVRRLGNERDAGELRNFVWVEVNGLQMPRPDVAYNVLWKALQPGESNEDEQSGEFEADLKNSNATHKPRLPMTKNISAARLCEHLQREFHSKNPARPMLVVLLDEMDFMLAGKNQVLYNLLEWQTASTAKLVLVGIANTMDLPERLPSKIRSRLGGHRITFPAYTRAQLENIIQQRLLQLDIFSDEAIQICAKSLAHQSGDVRQALSLCRKAAEVCLHRLTERDQGAKTAEGGEYFVTGEDLHEAQQAVSVSAPMSRLRACSKFECTFLVALRMEVRSNAVRSTGRGGVELEAVIDRFAILCKTHSFVPIPRLRGLLFICDELERSGMIRQISTRTSRYPLLELRCSHQELQDVFLTHPIGMQLIT